MRIRHSQLGIVLGLLWLAGCSKQAYIPGLGGGEGDTGSFSDPNKSYDIPKIDTAEAGLKLLAQDTKPAADPKLGRGAHKALLDEAYDGPMQRNFKLPPRVEDDYAMESLEISVFTGGQQHYIYVNIQTNDVRLESTSTTPPKQLSVGPAPLGFLLTPEHSLSVNALVKYEFDTAKNKTVFLKNLQGVLDFFPISTAHNRFQEGQNLVEATDTHFFNVLLHGLSPKTQLRFGARQAGDRIYAYVRLPSGSPSEMAVFRFTLAPESVLQYPVIYFPMTHDQWVQRAKLLPQHPISDLDIFPFVDPYRGLEEKLVYTDLKGVLELSTVQLDEENRKRILTEIGERPHLLFVLVALTNTAQVSVGELICPAPLTCRNIGDVAQVVNDSVLVISRDFLSEGRSMADVVTALVSDDRAQLKSQFQACYGNPSVVNFQAQLKGLEKLRAQKSEILKSLAAETSRALAAEENGEKKLSGRALRETVRHQELKRLLASLDENISELHTTIEGLHSDTFMQAGQRALGDITQKLSGFKGTALSIQAQPTNQAVDACSASLEPSFRRMQRIEAERIRMITETVELPEYFLAQVQHPQFAYQLDLVPTVELPVVDITHRGKVIGKQSPFFNPKALGTQPYDGLRIAFAIRNEGVVFVEDSQGQSRSVPKLSFVEQRTNDLRNMVYAHRTLIFMLETPRSLTLVAEWLKATYPSLRVAELIFDTHGQNGTIVLGEAVQGARWLNDTNVADSLSALAPIPKTESFNIFINACLVALDGGKLPRALNAFLGKGIHATTLAADENYKVSVRETRNFESQPGTAFTFQYTHGQLFVHEKQAAETLPPTLDGSDFVYVKKPIRFYSGERDTLSPTREIQSIFDISRINFNQLLQLRSR